MYIVQCTSMLIIIVLYSNRLICETCMFLPVGQTQSFDEIWSLKNTEKVDSVQDLTDFKFSWKPGASQQTPQVQVILSHQGFV